MCYVMFSGLVIVLYDISAVVWSESEIWEWENKKKMRRGGVIGGKSRCVDW